MGPAVDLCAIGQYSARRSRRFTHHGKWEQTIDHISYIKPTNMDFIQ